MYFRFGCLIVLMLAASGCVRNEDDFVVQLGHPADPGSRAGSVLAGSRTLEPELLSVKPGGITSPSKPAPSSGAHQHKQ